MVFDSNFTFYRGKLNLHVDMAFTNNIVTFTSFKILDKKRSIMIIDRLHLHVTLSMILI